MEVSGKGLSLIEIMPGSSVEDILNNTEAELFISEELLQK